MVGAASLLGIGPLVTPVHALVVLGVLVPLDLSRPFGRLPQALAGTAGVVEALLSAPDAEAPAEFHDVVEQHAGRGVAGARFVPQSDARIVHRHLWAP